MIECDTTVLETIALQREGFVTWVDSEGRRTTLKRV